MSSLLRVCRLAAALLLLSPATAFAQPGPGAVEGVATNADDGAPIAFALVRLLPASGEQETYGYGGVEAARGR